MKGFSYTYPISSFPNKKANAVRLEQDIHESDIIIGLYHITIANSQCIIVFKSELSDSEELLLNEIISIHTGDRIDSDLQKVKVFEESSDGIYRTGGHYMGTSFSINVPEGVGTYTKDYSFPYYISIVSAEWFNNIENIEDHAAFELAPDTIIGVIMSGATSGNTTFVVSDTVVDNICLGYYVKIGGVDLGRVFSVDKNNFTITTEYPIPIDMTPYTTPVMMTVKLIDDYLFNGVGKSELGRSKIGSEVIPPNTILRLVYKNVNGQAKTFSCLVDMLY